MRTPSLYAGAGLALCLLFSSGCAQDVGEVAFNPSSVVGPFQWNRAQGETLSLHLNKHPFTESLLPALGEFTALTGIAVDYNILPEEEYREKLIVELSSGSGAVDVFMTGPFDNWSYVGANWLEALDDYIDNPALTHGDYEPDDFYPALLEANRWNGKPGFQSLGKGSLWSIPVMVETYILAYRKDWAAELGLDAPKTYQEFYEMARAMTRSIDGAEARGVTARGLGTMPTIHTGFITAFASYGCRDFDDAMNVAINSPEAVEFTDLYVRAIKEFGPMAWTSNRWYDTKQQFESGAYGMILDCDFFASGYEDPGKSRVAGKVGYAPPPAGPDGTIRSNIWTWALGISSHSRHKLASWLFIQWATSKEQLVKAALNGNLNPSRKSVWNEPQVAEMVGKWGNYREVVEKNLEEYAQVCMTPEPEISAVGDRWARALQEIWSGAAAQAALDSAAADITRIIERTRVLDMGP